MVELRYCRLQDSACELNNTHLAAVALILIFGLLQGYPNTAYSQRCQIEAADTNASPGRPGARGELQRCEEEPLPRPPTPGSFTVPTSDSDGAYTISWGSSSGASRYQLLESPNNSSWTTIQNTSARSKAVSGKTNGRWYYKVRACNSSNRCSGYTATKSVLVSIVVTPPPTPSSITGPSTDPDGAFTLNWGASSGATSYTLQRRLNSGSWSTIQSTAARTHNASGLSNGTYGYRVRACNNGGCSSFTAQKNVVVDIDPLTQPLPPSSAGSPPPNPAATVGRTQGQSGVSSTGEGQYSIPIFTPPGINELEPEISLTYAHRQGESVAGVGWVLSGLSTIHRCARTRAQDNYSKAIELTRNDRLCMDGNQLRLTAGTYGYAYSQYRTERDTVAKIVAVGSAGNGPASFTVYQKGGLIYEYGSTTNSRIESLASGFTTTAHTWALSKIRDRSGNEILFTYQEDGSPNGDYRITGISYGRNATAHPAVRNYIYFTYENQPSGDIDTQYISGGKVVDTKRLKQINVYNYDTYPTTIVRRYNLTYESSLSSASRSRLKQVQECAGAPLVCLDPVTFTYQNGTKGLTAEVSSGTTIPSGATPILLDINGDARTDLLYPSGATTGTWRYRLATTSGGYGPERNTAISQVNFKRALATNYDGDGYDDLLVPYSGNTWWVIRGSSTGLVAPMNTGAPYESTVAIGDYVTFDYNGDSRDDLIWRRATGSSQFTVYVRYRTAAGGYSSTPTIVTGDYGYGSSTVTDFLGRFKHQISNPFDLNGDGMRDLVVVKNHWGQYKIHVYKGGGGEVVANGSSGITGLQSLDMNGDGYSDIVYTKYNSGIIFQLSTGKTLQAPITGPSLYNLVLSRAVATDWDGDGFEDLVMPNSVTGTWYYMRSKGESFANAVNTGLSTSGAIYTYPVDVNGDGMLDVAYLRSNRVVAHRKRAGIKSDLLTRVTDGNDNKIDYRYVTLTDGPYTKHSQAQYPQVDYVGPIYVVDRVTRQTGVGSSTYNDTYAYEGLRIDRHGRGLVGFAKRARTDSRNGIKTTEQYEQEFPYMGLLKSREVRLANNTLIRRENNTWETKTGGQGFQTYYLPYLDRSVIENFEAEGVKNGVKKNEITKTFVVDQFGTATQTTTQTVEPSSANGVLPGATYTDTVTLTGMLNYTGNWCIAMPSQTRAVNSHSEAYGSSITRTITRVWDTSKCRVKSETVEPSSSKYKVTRSFGYDAFGNINSETVTGVNMPSRTMLTYWGTNGRLPVSSTNALNQTTSYLWNYAAGMRKRQTDPNGLVTSWAHDPFGRITRITARDGSFQEIITSPCTSGDNYCSTGYNRVKLMMRREAHGADGSFVRYDDMFLDRFERPIQSRSPTMVGGVSTTRTAYNAFGQVSQVSKPTLNTSPSFFTYITYDAISRPKTITQPISAANPSTQVERIYYEGLTTRTVDPEGATSWRSRSAEGLVVRSKDHYGYYQQFDYDPFGRIRRVRDSLGNTLSSQTFAYGIDAFRTSSTDMDRGHWNYTPNALGEIVAYSDAKGQSFSATYDKLSRPKTRVEPEGQTTWTWGASSAAKNIGRIQSVSSPGFSESYIYDSKGRLSQRTTTSDTSYLTNWAYSSSTGYLESLTYPASTGGYRLKLRYEFQNGMLRRVSDFNNASSVYWMGDATDAWGNVIDETLGNGIRTVRGYDPVTARIDYIESGPGGGSARQSLEYLWNKVGSLTQRKDVNRSLTEDFYYDNLQRLDYSKRNNVTNLNLSYDKMGNITYKSDVGGSTWTYDPTRKHAVTNASGKSFAYDANGNVRTRNGKTITWTSYNKPKRLNGASGFHDFYYDANRKRYKQYYSAGSETTIFVDDLLEKRTKSGITEYRHHIKVNGKPVALYTRPTSGSATTEFFLLDHMGSVDVVTNGTGGLVVNESFAAYGDRRDPNDWSGPPSASDRGKIAGVTQRGFTYHTNLEGDSLIHMNGRVVDGAIGRFLSADPFVPNPDNTQAFNRYSYAYNNPLSYTDPNGYEPIVTISIIGTVGSFLKGIFGKKKKRPPPKGCFVSPTACYGQGGMTRVPGFTGIISINWENQPQWLVLGFCQWVNCASPDEPDDEEEEEEEEEDGPSVIVIIDPVEDREGLEKLNELIELLNKLSAMYQQCYELLETPFCVEWSTGLGDIEEDVRVDSMVQCVSSSPYTAPACAGVVMKNYERNLEEIDDFLNEKCGVNACQENVIRGKDAVMDRLRNRYEHLWPQHQTPVENIEAGPD